MLGVKHGKWRLLGGFCGFLEAPSAQPSVFGCETQKTWLQVWWLPDPRHPLSFLSLVGVSCWYPVLTGVSKPKGKPKPF